MNATVSFVSTDTDDLVTAAAIARRAGVGRAAVSNWRKRYPDFPRPRGGLYFWPEVLRWLRATGKADQLAVAGQTDTGTQRLDGVVAGSIAGVAVVPQERAVDGLGDHELLARTMAALLPFPDDLGDPGAGGTPDSGEPPVVLDPSCAGGVLLSAVADRFGDHALLVGHEGDEAVARTAAERLRSHPHAPPYAVLSAERGGDDRLAPYRGRAAGVLCLGPALTRPAPRPTDDRDDAPRHDLGWIGYALSLLRPRGTAVVAVPPTIAALGSGRDLRAELVRSGTLRTVVALPATLTGATGSMLHLWVLRRPPVDDRPVRMVALDHLAEPADLPTDDRGWEHLIADAGPERVRMVPRLDLLDDGVDLSPRRYVDDVGIGPADEFTDIVRRLRAAFVGVSDAIPDPVGSPGGRERSTVTIAELERAGALRVRARDTTPRAGDVLLRVLGRPPVVATGTADDDRGVAQVVEIAPGKLDAHFLALFLRAEVAALPVSNTHGAISRDDLRRCRIPRMPSAEQRRYGAHFRHVVDLQAAMAALAGLGQGVLEQTLHGLTAGALLPAAITDRETIVTEPSESETP